MKGALQARTAQAADAARAHTVSAALFSLSSALSVGAPLGPALAAARAAARDDELVAAVAKSLPEGSGRGPVDAAPRVATLAQLQVRLTNA